MAPPSEEAEVVVALSRAEALVLWRIEAALERILHEPLAPDYAKALAAARAAVGSAPSPCDDGSR